MADSPADLVTRLADSARAAVLNQRPSLLHGVGTVRGLVVELSVSGSGEILEATSYVERRLSASEAGARGYAESRRGQPR